MAEPEIEVEPEPLHPLLINTVFQTIASNLTFHELVNCSLVCKDWLQIIDSIICGNGGFTFRHGPSEIPDIYVELKKTERISSLHLENVDFDKTPEIFDVIRHPKAKQLALLHIVQCYISEESIERLLLEFAPLLQVLEISICVNQDGPLNKLMMFPLSSNESPELCFPKLKRFLLVSSYYVCNLYGIASTFPNLVELDLLGIIIPHHPDLKPKSLPLLRKLSLAMPGFWDLAWDQELWHLMNMKLALTELHFTNVHKDTNYSLIKKFLKSQAATLKIFEMSSSSRTTHEDYQQVCAKRFDLPRLPKLTVLKLDDPFFKNLNVLLTKTPNLQFLNCGFFENAEIWTGLLFYGKRPMSFPSVTKINLTYIEPRHLEKIASIFPYLEELRINCGTDKVLEAVFTYFRHIKSFKVRSIPESGVGITDEGFLWNEFAAAALQEVDLGSTQPEIKPEDETRFIILPPSIRTMTNLEILTVLSAISTKTVVDGFLHLPKLKRLIMLGIRLCPKTLVAIREAGFATYDIKKIFRQIPPDAPIYGFVRYKEQMTEQEKMDLFMEVATSFHL